MEEKGLLSLIGKFIGSQKISSVEISERKTYLKNNVITVKFEDGDTKEFPEEILRSVATDQISSLSELRERTVIEPLRKIQAICLDAELYLDDIKFLLNVSFENWINGMLTNITIKDIDSVLNKKNNKEDGE